MNHSNVSTEEGRKSPGSLWLDYCFRSIEGGHEFLPSIHHLDQSLPTKTEFFTPKETRYFPGPILLGSHMLIDEQEAYDVTCLPRLRFDKDPIGEYEFQKGLRLLNGIPKGYGNHRGSLVYNTPPKDSFLARKNFHCAANAGHSEAQFYLGLMARQGLGFKIPCPAFANKCIRCAAEGGLGQARTDVGLQRLDDSATEHLAAHWFAGAADSGDARGQFELGRLYYFGYGGVNRSFSRAFKCFHTAGLSHNPQAFGFLGEFYLGGICMPQSERKGILMYKVAASRGDVEAGRRLHLLGEHTFSRQEAQEAKQVLEDQSFMFRSFEPRY